MPASLFYKFNAFVEAVAEKKHNLGSDQLKIALTNSAPNASTGAVLTDITEITYTFLSSRNVTTSSSSQTGGTYSLVNSDLTITSSGGSTGPWRYIVLYNDTATNKDLIGYYDYSTNTTLLDGDSTVLDFASTTITIA